MYYAPFAVLMYIFFILDTPSKSTNRPLSANRMSQKDKLDSDAEASAVIAALRAENEKASKLKHESGSRNAPDTPQVLYSVSLMYMVTRIKIKSAVVIQLVWRTHDQKEIGFTFHLFAWSYTVSVKD